MKRILAVTLLATMMLSSLSGCGKNEPESSATSGDKSPSENSAPKTELVVADFEDIDDCNPHLYTGSMWFQEMVYETLVSVTPEGIVPGLAESWEISDDGTIYTFKIREGVTFSDGLACDAYAIEANFDALWDNIERHVWMESANLITGYEATSATEFVLTLSDPYYPMLTELGVTRPYAIGSPNTFKDGTTKDGVTSYVGTGPYVMEEHVENEYVVMKANEEYWGEVPDIKKITVKVIPESQTRVLALEKGEIDLIYGANMLEVSTLNKYMDSEEFDVSISDPMLTKHLLLNSTTPALASQAVREAITHAIDKAAISEGVYYGIEPVAERLYDESVPYCTVDVDTIEYDVEQAKKMLADEGWKAGDDGILVKDGERLSLKFVYDNNSVTDKTICEFIQAELLKVGIEITLEGFERSTYFDMLKMGDFDITINIPWGNPYDPHAAMSAMRAPVYGDYEAQLGLENKAEIDQAISDVLVSVDEKERQELYDFILTELHDSCIYIPLVYETNKALYSSELKNVGFATSVYVIPYWDMSF